MYCTTRWRLHCVDSCRRSIPRSFTTPVITYLCANSLENVILQFRIMGRQWWIIVVLVVLMFSARASSCSTEYEDLSLVIMHTNDVHSRFEEFKIGGSTCKEKDSIAGRCVGGAARMATKVKEIRKEHPHALFLNAGDYYQGTIFYTLLKWRPVVTIMNMLGYTAMSLGNHEFDDAVKGVLPLVKRVQFPVLVANLNLTCEQRLQPYIQKSMVKTVKGKKIGIVGYLTEETADLSLVDDTVKFLNVIESVRQEVQKLKSEDVSIIIALGHAGHFVDKKIAEEVPEVDIVVGGHTDTFLYTGTPPSTEVPSDEYPVVITGGKRRSPALVVQEYTFGKYLGYLEVQFNSLGDVVAWDGNPIFLNSSVSKDPEVLKEVQSFKAQVDTKSKIAIGSTEILLDGERIRCRFEECSMGDFITDAYVEYYRRVEGNDVKLGFINSGGIRSSISAGEVTFGDIIEVLPFDGNIELATMSGAIIKQSFENSVTKYDVSRTAGQGRFLQVSGFKVKFDLSKSEGERVIDIRVKNDANAFEALNTQKVYKVVTTAYILNGKDFFTMLLNANRNTLTAKKDSEILQEYFKGNSPIKTIEEVGRIKFV